MVHAADVGIVAEALLASDNSLGQAQGTTEWTSGHIISQQNYWSGLAEYTWASLEYPGI